MLTGQKKSGGDKVPVWFRVLSLIDSEHDRMWVSLGIDSILEDYGVLTRLWDLATQCLKFSQAR